MDLQCFHSRSRLKIRRAPSCKISSSQTSSSFHGSCRAQVKKKGFKQPLIFHTFEPDIILTEPAEFMSLVQRLTGSANTRRLLRTSMRKSKEMQSSLRVADVQVMQQGMHSMHQSRKDPLKEGNTIILAPTSFINPNDLRPPSPASPNYPNYSIKHAPELPLSSHANINPPLSPASSKNTSPLSSDTINQHKNHPSSSLSSNSANSEENPFSSSSGTINMNMSSQLLPFSPKTPFSSSCLHEPSLIPSTPKPNKCKPLIIDNNQIPLLISPNSSNCVHTNPMSIILPLPAKASDELSNTSRGPPWSPLSPNSSSEGEHTDNLSGAEGGASPNYREASISIGLEEEGSTLINEAEEDAHFFVFSGDSYYGSSSYDEAAQDIEVEFQYSNVLDSFPQFSMPLGTHDSEALSFFKDNITLEEEVLYS